MNSEIEIMNKINKLITLCIWGLLTAGIWSTYYFQTLFSPIVYPLSGLIFIIALSIYEEVRISKRMEAKK